MLIGDSGVGKTCILVRFKNNKFMDGSFFSTVGIDFRVSTSYLLTAIKLQPYGIIQVYIITIPDTDT